jgi:hypothetical protein
MHDICAPLLYKECVTNDFPTFAFTLGSNANTETTNRLHLFQKRHSWEPSYEKIFEDGWAEFDCKSEPESIQENHSLNSMRYECWDLIEAGIKIRQLLNSGTGNILPKLQFVSMGGIGEQIFNGPQGWILNKDLDNEFIMGIKLLAPALLDIPSVQHYCQAVAHGPLALPGRTIISQSALKTFTLHHHRERLIFCNCERSCDHTHSPPIILGAINRYYCQNRGYDSDPITPQFANGWSRKILMPILQMLCRPVLSIADPETGKMLPFKGEITAELLEGTQIEIYNIFRTYRADKSLRKKIKKNKKIVETLPPQSLSWFQNTLEGYLDQCCSGWVGRVKFYNREDAPLCPACGYDFRVLTPEDAPKYA